MAVPSSAEIKMSGIMGEKTDDDYTVFNDEGNQNISLRGLSVNGVNDFDSTDITVNINSTSKPDGSAPHAMSEFYGYDHDAAGTSFSSVYGSFTLDVATNQAQVYSGVKTFSVVNGSGALTIVIGSIAPNTGTLAVAASSTGDPGTSGTSNSGTGYVNEGTTLSHTPTLWSQAGTTIYLRFRLSPHTSATQDIRSVTISNNSVSTSGGNVTCTTNNPKSDIRFKTNIDRIGYSDMNIPIYLFNYKDDLNTTYKGVMAQDLLKLGFKDSVILGEDGYYRVDYSKLDVELEKV